MTLHDYAFLKAPKVFSCFYCIQISNNLHQNTILNLIEINYYSLDLLCFDFQNLQKEMN